LAYINKFEIERISEYPPLVEIVDNDSKINIKLKLFISNFKKEVCFVLHVAAHY
jgi:sugar-specific transcriptional regulator TrmB